MSLPLWLLLHTGGLGYSSAEQLRLPVLIGCSFIGYGTLDKKPAQIIAVAFLLPALAGKRTKDLLPESRLTREFMVILVLYSYLPIYNLEIPDLHILSLACH